MFRTFAKKFLPNPFDQKLKRCAKRGGKKILLGWNRGLGDIALGLYAMVERVREYIPDAEITFVTRENLKEGFSMLSGIKTIVDQSWQRGKNVQIDPELKKNYDLVIEKPSPTDWVYWQRGKVIPRLKWDPRHEHLFEKFNLKKRCVGVQISAETNYGLWRNWPLEKWQSLIDHLEQIGSTVLLFGYGDEPKFENKNVIDLRGKTSLFELLSIVKNCLFALVLPDSGISSMVYYLGASFPIRHVTLWADPNHGILKQNVSSPNPKLTHIPLIAKNQNLASLCVQDVMSALFPVQRCAAIILAGGEGSRLKVNGPKGLYKIAGKTLFQWLLEKVPRNLPIAIMTSPLNHDQIVSYFKENRNFDLDIHFFQQEVSTLLDEKRNPTPFTAPNGNGSVFHSFVRANLHQVFSGIDCISVCNIENPLTYPFDASLIAALRENEADAVVQCIKKEAQDRFMGAVVEKGERAEIVEYTEQDPNVQYRYGYTGQMVFNFSFFCEMAKKNLPIHWVLKKGFWKGEKFIFDALVFAERVKLFCASRQTCYAPIKDLEDVGKFLK